LQQAHRRVPLGLAHRRHVVVVVGGGERGFGGEQHLGQLPAHLVRVCAQLGARGVEKPTAALRRVQVDRVQMERPGRRVGDRQRDPQRVRDPVALRAAHPPPPHPERHVQLGDVTGHLATIGRGRGRRRRHRFRRLAGAIRFGVVVADRPRWARGRCVRGEKRVERVPAVPGAGQQLGHRRARRDGAGRDALRGQAVEQPISALTDHGCDADAQPSHRSDVGAGESVWAAGRDHPVVAGGEHGESVADRLDQQHLTVGIDGRVGEQATGQLGGPLQSAALAEAVPAQPDDPPLSGDGDDQATGQVLMPARPVHAEPRQLAAQLRAGLAVGLGQPVAQRAVRITQPQPAGERVVDAEPVQPRPRGRRVGQRVLIVANDRVQQRLIIGVRRAQGRQEPHRPLSRARARDAVFVGVPTGAEQLRGVAHRHALRQRDPLGRPAGPAAALPAFAVQVEAQRLPAARAAPTRAAGIVMHGDAAGREELTKPDRARAWLPCHRPSPRGWRIRLTLPRIDASLKSRNPLP
jgi:hypothetical protein